MDLAALRQYLRTRPAATEGAAFGPEHWTFKVGGKLFAVVAWDEEPVRISLKCDPARVDELRAVFAAVRPAPYFNKRHWNLVILDGSVPVPELEAMIDESYALVVAGLSRRLRAELGLEGVE